MNTSVFGLALSVGLLSVLWVDGSLAQLEGEHEIFRVWSLPSSAEPVQSFSEYEALLNEEARQERAAAQGAPRLGCRAGLPALMFGPTPIEFTQGDDQIVIRLPAYGVERIVHMDQDDDGVAQEPTSSALGFSVGYWDHSYLIVETTLVDSPYFDNVGTPLSDQAKFLERFTVFRGRGDEGAGVEGRLNYSLTTIDRGMFTGPIVLDRYWEDETPGGGTIEPDDCPP